MTFESLPQLQQLFDIADDTRSRFGLKISCTKTQVQYIGRDAHQCRMDIKMKEDILNGVPVDDFVYLSGII